MATKKLKKQFVQVLHDHQGIIHQICKVYYASSDDQADAFQEVVLQLWKAYPRFRKESKVTTWMYRVALNTVLKNIRQQQAQLPTQNIEEVTENKVVNFHQEMNDYLQFALQQLNELEKAIVILHLEGYNYAEIAELLELTETNVSSKLHRIKQKIRKIIKQEQYAAG